MIRFISRYTIIMLTLMVTACLYNKVKLPDGWQTPNKIVQSVKWRNHAPHKYLLVDEDFNGDGLRDEARLLVNPDDNSMKLFVFLSTGLTYELDVRKAFYIDAMGIEAVPPGRYKTACGKKVVDCDINEPEEIVLKNYAIKYFKHESASGFYYWDSTINNFNFIGITD